MDPLLSLLNSAKDGNFDAVPSQITLKTNINSTNLDILQNDNNKIEITKSLKDLPNAIKDKLSHIDLDCLSEDQQSAILSVLNRKNILLTGPAGTGKTFTIKIIKDIYTALGKKISLTSTTGASATLFDDGRTIHSWSGIGICSSKESALKRVMTYKKPQYRIKTTNLLIIDEISMMQSYILDILDYVCRMIRQSQMPFGGLQVVLVGDFFQLGPVKCPKYAFEADCWNNVIHEVHDLTQIFRQENIQFCNALNEIRKADISQETINLFSQCIGREFNGDIKPTELYPLKVDVSQVNEYELWELATEDNMVREIESLDDVIQKPKPRKPMSAKFKKQVKATLNKHCMAPEVLQLCVGAQVMLIQNLSVESGLANGSRGILTGFGPAGQPIVKFMNGQELAISTHSWTVRINENTIAKRKQYPIILAWAITVHKCVSYDTIISTPQGMAKIGLLASNMNKGWNNMKFKVHSSDETSITKAVYVGDIEDSIIIKTRMGFTLEGSHRHPVLTMNSKGQHEWKKLSDIEKDDVIIIRRGLLGGLEKPTKINFSSDFEYRKEYTIPKRVTSDLCYLMGMLVGDGSYNKNSNDYMVEYVSIDEELLDQFNNICLTRFGIECGKYIRKKENHKDLTKLYFCSKLIRMFLAECGLTFTKCREKHVPWTCMYNTIKSQRLFIKGLFDTDGGVSSGFLNYTTASTILAREVHTILCNLGIISRLYYLKGVDAWRVDITGKDARTYMSTIGFVVEYKQRNGMKQFGSPSDSYKSNIGEIPNGQALICQLRKEKYSKHGSTIRCNYIKKPFSSLLSRIIKGTCKLRINHLEYISKCMPDMNEFESGRILLSYIKNKWFFDTIKTIEYSTCQMFDLEVEETHSFVSNGIVSHNCQGSTLDLVRVDLSSNIFADGQSYTSISRARTLDGLSIIEIDWDKITANQRVKEFYAKNAKL